MGRKVNESPVGVGSCHGRGGNQLFVWTEKGEIQSTVGCLTPEPAPRSTFRFAQCQRQPDSNQVFEYKGNVSV